MRSALIICSVLTHQEEQIVVAALLGVDAPARGGAAAQDELAQPRSLQTGGDKVFMFINDCDDEWVLTW